MNQVTKTREQIIDTAFKLLLQRGMNGLSYRDIADPLGVKNAAIHYHFPSKTDLVKALIEQNHQLLKKATAEFMAYGGPARPQLEGLFHFTRTQMELGRPVCMVGALSVDYEELTEANKRSLDRFMTDTVTWLAKVLETGRAQGEFEFRGGAQSKAVAEALRRYRGTGSPAPGAPTVADIQGQMSGAMQSASGVVGTDPVCGARNLWKKIQGKGTTYHLYRTWDERGERPLLTDHLLDADDYRGNLQFQFEYLGKFDGECAAVAAWNKALRDAVGRKPSPGEPPHEEPR